MDAPDPDRDPSWWGRHYSPIEVSRQELHALLAKAPEQRVRTIVLDLVPAEVRLDVVRFLAEDDG
jgi:hypothetical protein